MKRMRLSYGALVAVLAPTLAVMGSSACGDDRGGFHMSGGTFDPDASADVGGSCRLQCSLDRRSIVDCSGTVVETCRPELACGAGVCQEPCAAATAERSSDGCEFQFQMPRLYEIYPQDCYAAYIVNKSTTPVDLSLEFKGKPLDLSKAVFRQTVGDAKLVPHVGAIPPGESVVLFVSDWDGTRPRGETEELYHVACPRGVVPAIADDLPLSGTRITDAFRLKTNLPVGIATIYPFGGGVSYRPTATLLLPIATWAKEHVIVNAWENSMLGGAAVGKPAAQIFASEDNTEVTILPNRDVQNGEGVVGGPAGIPLTYKLDKGQVLHLVQTQELTGSFLSSTKPTSIVGANSCAFIPADVGACDITAQQLPAFEQWGSEYVGVGYRPRLGSEHEVMAYRVVAARDGTRLDYDPPMPPPGAPTQLSAGEAVTFRSGVGDAFVVRSQDADHPIYLAAYMTGGEQVPNANIGWGWGDPDFVNVIPAGQYLNSYSFYADPSYSETSLVIVRAKTQREFSDVWLECAGPLTDWKAVGTKGQYEYRRVDLSRGRGPGDTFGGSTCQHGLQRMRSEGAFTATIWGWDLYGSYAYPGGMAQRKLVESPLGPLR